MNKGKIKLSGDLFIGHLLMLDGFKLNNVTYDGRILTLYVESDKIKIDGSEIVLVYEGKNEAKLIRMEETPVCKVCNGHLQLMGRVEQEGKNLGCYYCDVCISNNLIDDGGEK